MIKRKYVILSVGILAYYSFFLKGFEILMNKQIFNLFLIETLYFLP